MTQRDCAPLSPQIVAVVADRHGLDARVRDPRPWRGATSCVYPLGEAVLKVPRDDPAALDAVRIDAAVAPVARAAGIRTPRLVAFDDARDVLPVPYAVYERVPGEPLGSLDVPPEAVPQAWRELGRDLGLVHSRLRPEGALAKLRTFDQSPALDPRPWVDEAAGAGHLAADEARWLTDLLDRLAPAALAPVPKRVCHGDVNADNVLVAPDDRSYLAVIDWAGTGWLDPVWDFAGVSLRAVPYLLEGHRREAPLPEDETAEARILWCHLQFALFQLRQRPPSPDRPMARALANARTFLVRSRIG